MGSTTGNFADGELEVVQHLFPIEGKPPKRIYVPKGAFIGTVFQFTRPWDFGFLCNLYKNAARGGSFLEVGANIGTDTIVAAEFFQRCYCFEPLPAHVELLRKNMELNHITNVQLFPMAVSDRAGTARFFVNTRSTGSSSLYPNDRDMDQSEEVQAVTLDAAMPLEIRDVTFMHIDTEGHDIKVLQGARQFIGRQGQRPLVRMEFQPRTLALHGSHVAELLEFIRQFRYAPFMDAASHLVPLSQQMLIDMFHLWRSTEGWIDIFLLPAGLEQSSVLKVG